MGSSFNLLYIYIYSIFPASFIKEAITFIKNHLDVELGFYFWDCYSTLLAYVSSFRLAPWCFGYKAIEYALKLGVVISPALISLLRTALVLWGLCAFILRLFFLDL